MDSMCNSKKSVLKSFSFEIDYPKEKKERAKWGKEYGMNAIYAGKHWTRRKKDSEFWHNLVYAHLLKCSKPKEMFDKVELIFSYNDRLDLSNHAYMAKMIEDALKGIVIIDDNRKYVKRIIHEWNNEDKIKITINEIGEF